MRETLDSIVKSSTKDPLLELTIGEHLTITAQKHTGKVAVISHYEQRRLTFSQVLEKVECLISGYLRMGLKRGDRFAIWCPNSMEWYLTALATAKAGLVSVLINPFLQGLELQYCLEKVDVRAIMTTTRFRSQNYLDILNSIETPNLQYIIVDTDEVLPFGIRQCDVYKMGNTEIISTKNATTVSTHDPCTVFFTSGSTAKPKAVVLSHFGLVNYGYYSGKAIDNHKQIFCCLGPFFHAMGFSFGIISATVHGTTLVIPSPSFDPLQSINSMLKERCTIASGTPTMFVDLIRVFKEQQLKLEHLTEVFLGGSSCFPQLLKELKNTFQLKRIYNGYGLSETCGAFMSTNIHDPEDKVFSTVGKLLEHGEVKVVDEQGEIVPIGYAGELCYRGYQVMLGYYGDKEATKKVLSDDGWLKTGDLFILDGDGYGKFLGRIDDCIIRGGENIAPSEIEAILNTHPNILESFVVGVPDKRLGMDICAFLRLPSNIDLQPADLKTFCKGKIAHFKIPKYIEILSEPEIPKTATGKVSRKLLRKMFLKKHNLEVV